MPLLDRLRKCHAELQKAVKQPMQGPEEDELLTEIANISNMATLLKERVAAKQAGRARQAFDLLKPWMDDLNDVASIRSNLTHIFHNQHKAPTVQIVEDLTSEDPNLLMDFACTVRTGKWTDKHMTFELYKCVKAWLKDSLRPPWDEKVSKALNEALNELMETTLKDSETFKAFFEHVQLASRRKADQPPDARLAGSPGAKLPATSVQPGRPVPALQPLDTGLPATSPQYSRSPLQPGPVPTSQPPVTSLSPRGVRLHPGGWQTPTAMAPSQTDVWLQATLPSQPGGPIPALQPDARQPAMPPSQQDGPLLNITQENIRLHIELPVLCQFTPLAAFLNKLPWIPLRAEMLFSYIQHIPSFVELFLPLTANWNGVLRILPPEIASGVKESTLNSKTYNNIW